MTAASGTPKSASAARFDDLVRSRWSSRVTVDRRGDRPGWVLGCEAADLAALGGWLFSDLGMSYATLVVEETDQEWLVRHVLYGGDAGTVVELTVRQPLDLGRTGSGASASTPSPGLEHDTLPSLAAAIHAADWQEREAEDLFGLEFTGHPRLGDFVLHEHWPEGVNPMRASFSTSYRPPEQAASTDWEPVRLVEAEGAFIMPIGPVFSDYAESARFFLETVGEDVLRAIPRLFYKYRAVEKIAQGRSADDVVLLAERFGGVSAFAHSLALCQAVERIGAAEVPPRATALRLVGAELERIRHHVAVLAKLCGSTALAVPTSLAALLEEELLRASCQFSGHRYLFGLNRPGGLSRDVADQVCGELVGRLQRMRPELARLRTKLIRTSSFLDRLEEVGVIRRDDAVAYGLVGPVARASAVSRDLRRVLPYGPYRAGPPVTVPCEEDADGYARMRVFFAEIEASISLIAGAVDRLPGGPVAQDDLRPGAGTALGWVEAPGGAAFHWVRTDDQGKVVRWRLGTPGFANWHGFHLAAEKFAFQDFPIILASMGLSIAENDR